ncbi:MAG: PEP-CTERM sorting domain-containing protein [Puniceicoccales bacterium]|jgi:hypothetical protein|nr:PEP-CTERM sorting domain-containing protein [Puniceicoccales bacterium]
MSPLLKSPVTLAIILSAAQLGAATISWQTAQTISGDTDVATTGSKVYAYNFTADTTTATVNGVLFDAGTGKINEGHFSDTIGNITFVAQGNPTLSTAYVISSNSSAFAGTSGSPFNTLSTSYQSILKSALGNDGGSASSKSMLVTLDGLTANQEYMIQFWVNDSRGTPSLSSRVEYVSDTLGTSGSQQLKFNTAGAEGGLGQYIIGTFTADNTSQSFYLNSSNTTQMNALQLRAIPEPSTYAWMGGIGLLGFLALRRRK